MEERLTPAEIKRVRKRAGLSQKDFAQSLKCGIASVKRWELGTVTQHRSADQSIRQFAVHQKEQPMSEDHAQPRREPVSFGAKDEGIIDSNYAKLDERQTAIVDCARVACGRFKDSWAAFGVLEDGNWKDDVRSQMFEAFLIFERIKDLSPETDWNGLGLMLKDDPRIRGVK